MAGQPAPGWGFRANHRAVPTGSWCERMIFFPSYFEVSRENESEREKGVKVPRMREHRSAPMFPHPRKFGSSSCARDIHVWRRSP